MSTTSPRDALRVSVEPHPAPADAEVVLAGLRAFNDAALGPTERTPLGVFVRDADDCVLGGLTGIVKHGWLYVDLFWLPEALRGRGLGTALLAAAEDEARRRGCVASHLETTDYQALPFYERCGYTVFGVLDGYPVGAKSFYLRKTL